MYDENGYPTDEALDKIETFEGTPKTMVEYLTSLFNGGFVKTDYLSDGAGDGYHEVRFVTGGWSGAESVLGRLPGTMFAVAGWESSQRGGLEVYRFYDTAWEMKQFWGKFERHPEYVARPTPDELLHAQIRTPPKAVVEAMIAAWNAGEPSKRIEHPASHIRTFYEMWVAGIGALDTTIDLTPIVAPRRP